MRGPVSGLVPISYPDPESLRTPPFLLVVQNPRVVGFCTPFKLSRFAKRGSKVPFPRFPHPSLPPYLATSQDVVPAALPSRHMSVSSLWPAPRPRRVPRQPVRQRPESRLAERVASTVAADVVVVVEVVDVAALGDEVPAA